MRFPRRSGILLHLTSLPGPWGIGGMGEEAERFIDRIADAGQHVWQVLPLNPVGFGNCPYASPSAFAGNPLLIDPAKLVREGLLRPEDIQIEDAFEAGRVDYPRVNRFKADLLEKAYRRFLVAGPDLLRDFYDFCFLHDFWLGDYALFMVLKRVFNGEPWFRWPADLASRKPGALAAAWKKHRRETKKEKFIQFIFYRQWEDLREAARRRKVAIIGDIPFFVSHDSADVWVHRRLFQVDETGKRTALSGVPPTDIDGTSQIWGNPLYNWKECGRDGYSWWRARFRIIFELVDIVRIDHFSGFYACWRISPGAKTSADGRWEKGPGKKLFEKIESDLGRLPVMAEALEPLIFLQVQKLLDELGFPGIRGLQFGFYGGENNPHMPEDYPENCVAYTGTHDSDTSRGWFAGLDPALQNKVMSYLGISDPDRISRGMIRAVFSSVADTAIIPLQDLCGLGSSARMNIPGRPSGQWEWRYRPAEMPPGRWKWLKKLTARCAR